MQRLTVVTGASSGIGKAIVELLAKENHKVLAISRNPDLVQKDPNIISIKAGIYSLIYKYKIYPKSQIFNQFQMLLELIIRLNI